MRQIKLLPHPPRHINYPIYTQEEIDRRLIEVIKFVLSIPEERLKPPKQQEALKSPYTEIQS